MFRLFKSRTVTAALLLTSLALGVSAQTITAGPSLFNFQGRIATPAGNPVPDGTYNITLSLWDAASAGNKRWEQVYANITVKNGTFAALLNLGSGFTAGNAIDIALNGSSYLQIKIGSDVALTPRQQLVSVPYAFKANTVPDASITGAKIATGTITADKLASGLLTGAAGGDLTGFYPNPTLATLASSLFKVSGGLMTALGSGTVLDVQQLSAPLTGIDYAWQSFTASGSGIIQGVDIWCGTSTSQNHGATLTIYDGEGTTGTLLRTYSVSIGAVQRFQNFAVNFPVVGGHQYTWQLGTSASTRYGYASGNPYSGGKSDLGDTLDYAFRTFLQGSSPSQITMAASLNINGNINMTTGNTLFFADNGQIRSFDNSHQLLFRRSENKMELREYGDLIFSPGATNYIETKKVVMLGNGNVGIGITTPGDKLSITGGALSFAHPTDLVPYVGMDYDQPTDALRLRTNIGTNSLNTTAVTIQRTTGNVGIGVAPSPSAKLHVRGRAYVEGTSGFGGAPTITLAVGDTDTGLNWGSDGTLQFYADNVKTAQLTPGSINVYGQLSADYLLSYGNITGNHITATSSSGQSNFDHVVAIRQQPFDAALSVNGTGYSWAIASNQRFFAAGFVTSSDARLKTNIAMLPNALETILGLRGISYEWKPETEQSNKGKAGKEVGFLAQEIEKLIPAIVHDGPNGYKAVNYQGIIPYLVEAIKTQQKQLTAREERLSAVEAENKALKAQMQGIAERLQQLEQNANRQP